MSGPTTRSDSRETKHQVSGGVEELTLLGVHRIRASVVPNIIEGLCELDLGVGMPDVGPKTIEVE